MAKIIGIVPAVLLGLLLGATAPADATVPPTPAARVYVGPGPADGVTGRLVVQSLLESRVIALTNRQRRAHGCRALRANSLLRKAARAHTVRMAVADLMSHQLPGEPYFSVRITNAGYRNWRLVAENVARGFSSPLAVVRAWMASPGHRRNILNCRLRDLGVGVVLKDGQLWWTQNFGRR
ncbi:CAP domain-containing protein [Nocardioides caeni]|uniref:CAP domain-containing protein n=2 Tax=Nocardioides caeni TaxID=574700 RepID=A0A4S8N1P8_9ACTN|nr:CAP domain-containing protein [Nocardioides caeni]